MLNTVRSPFDQRLHARTQVAPKHVRWWLALVLTSAGCGALPDVTVTPQGDTITSESGGSVTLAIALSHKPLAPVDVYAVSSSAREGSVSGPVHIDQTNWSAPHALVVTGEDDLLSDGDASYEVTVFVRLARAPGSPAEQVASFRFVNRDDDVPQFQGLGDLPGGDVASHVSALSADGSVVVGWSSAASGDEAVRWTTSEGLHGLGGPASRAQAVSPDGRLITGSVGDARYDGGRAAALWRGADPFQLLAKMPTETLPPALFWFVDATVVQDDGLTWGTCRQFAAYGEPIACKFDPTTSTLTNIPASYVHAAHLDGHFVGSANAERHAPFTTQATYDAAPLGYPSDVFCFPYTGCLADARDFVSGDLIVGTSSIPAAGDHSSPPVLIQTAFVYTRADGVTRLPDLPGGADASGAYAVSADGRLIVGFGTDERGTQAVVWRDRVPCALEDLILNAGGALPAGTTLSDVRALSADAHVLAGNGSDGQGHPNGYRVVLPHLP